MASFAVLIVTAGAAIQCRDYRFTRSSSFIGFFIGSFALFSSGVPYSFIYYLIVGLIVGSCWLIHTSSTDHSFIMHSELFPGLQSLVVFAISDCTGSVYHAIEDYAKSF